MYDFAYDLIMKTWKLIILQTFTQNYKWRNSRHYWCVMRVSIGFGENTSPKSTSWSQWRKDVQVNVSDFFWKQKDNKISVKKKRRIVLLWMNFYLSWRVLTISIFIFLFRTINKWSSSVKKNVSFDSMPIIFCVRFYNCNCYFRANESKWTNCWKHKSIRNHHR